MRKITPAQSAFFAFLVTIILTLGGVTTSMIYSAMAPGDFRGVIVVFGGFLLIYLYAFLVYRLFLVLMPLELGELALGSRGEFVSQVNTLFYVMLFYPLTRTHVIPVTLLRFIYIALGARLGSNSYSAGLIMDPPLTVLGNNCMVGHDAVLFAHVIEGRRLALYPIRIGNDVTVGATAVVMPDVVIGDGAVVSVGAVVTKGTRIGAGEVWGGVPAKLLKARSEPSAD